MSLTRRKLLRLVAGVLALPALPRIARAQSFPNRPITIIVPYPPGGPTDTIARLVAERMRGSLGQPIVIENMSGFIPSPGAARIDVFGRGGGLRLAEQLGVPLLAEIPLDLAVREGSDNGQPVVRSQPGAPAAAAMRDAARKIAQLLPVGVRA